ncbi:MAG TPA: DUF2085 domain-containing protein [Bacteroidota bacterium]
MKPSEPSRRIYGTMLLLVALWCSLIVLAPLLQSFAGETQTVASVIYKFYSRICHQLDDRSFHIGGEKFAVCIRCSAIYFSFFAGLALVPLLQGLGNRTPPQRRWLMAAMLPMLVDVLLSVSGIHASTDLTRFVTGSLLGVTVPLYIVPILFDSLAKLSESSKGEPLYARKTE